MACYSLEDIKKELSTKLELEEVKLEAWEKVTFPTKKDGTPFKNMAKNFENAIYKANSHALQPGGNCLKVLFNTELSGYQSDIINCYEIIDYLLDKKKLAKTENYMPKLSYLNQVYCYDLEDIKQAIAERIEYCKQNIAQLRFEIKNADIVYNNFKHAYTVALRQLENDTNKSDEKYSDLYELVKKTVVSRYPFC